MPDDITAFFDAKERGHSTSTSEQLTVRNVQVDSGIRYIYIGEDSSGWVDVLGEQNNRFSLCAYTKIQLLERKEKRVYFKILDGSSGANKTVSMKEAAAPTYLRKLTRTKKSLVLTVTGYNNQPVKMESSVKGEQLQHPAELNYGSEKCKITLKTGTDNAYSKIPMDTYKVKSPDCPHDQNYIAQYRSNDKKQYDAVWFPIEYRVNSNYIHMGNISHGCVTILSMEDWVKVYQVLIKNRTDDKGLYCATIEIKP